MTTIVALMTTTNVRVRDVSGVGCLLESARAFPVGTIGSLEIQLEGARRFEWFRVARVQALDGDGGTFAAGAEFLPLAPAGPHSLRAIGRRLRQALGMPGMAGRSSGDTGNSGAHREGATGDVSAPCGDSAPRLVEFPRRGDLQCAGNAVAEIGESGAQDRADRIKEKQI